MFSINWGTLPPIDGRTHTLDLGLDQCIVDLPHRLTITDGLLIPETVKSAPALTSLNRNGGLQSHFNAFRGSASGLSASFPVKRRLPAAPTNNRNSLLMSAPRPEIAVSALPALATIRKPIGRPPTAMWFPTVIVVPELPAENPQSVKESRGEGTRYALLKKAGLVKTFQFGGGTNDGTPAACNRLIREMFGAAGLIDWVVYRGGAGSRVSSLTLIEEPRFGWDLAALRAIGTKNSGRLYIGPASSRLTVPGLDENESDDGDFDALPPPRRLVRPFFPAPSLSPIEIPDESLSSSPQSAQSNNRQRRRLSLFSDDEDDEQRNSSSSTASISRCGDSSHALHSTRQLVDALNSVRDPDEALISMPTPRRAISHDVLVDSDDEDFDPVMEMYKVFQRKVIGRPVGTGLVWYIKKESLVEDVFRGVAQQPQRFDVRPIMDYQEGCDLDGPFRDVFSQFWSKVMLHRDPLTVGSLFVGNSDDGVMTVTHILQETDSSKPNYFKSLGKLLFICLVHRGPFPTQLDRSVFRYMLDMPPEVSCVRYVNCVAGNFIDAVRNSEFQSDFVHHVEGLKEWLEANSELVRYSAVKWEGLTKEETIMKIARTVLYDFRSGNLSLMKEGFNQLSVLQEIQAMHVWEHLEVMLWRTVQTGAELLAEVIKPSTRQASKFAAYGHFVRFVSAAGKEKIQELMRYIVGFANVPLVKKIEITFNVGGQRYLPTAKTCTPSLTLGTTYSNDAAGFGDFSCDLELALDNGKDTMGFV
ncbi:hypothetical protein BV898_02104 [Hypsibius exemplaris]|uniref:HECT domain-containing protein n=1 Tax=Hypsibius exemplaris TaxID=2072580 RepID=A0A1W0X9T2_HYPEX|nr:hypothetical protein BV898_02104 [Hypsibius exemplaris]